MSEPRLFRGGEDRPIVHHAATELRPVHRAELRTRRLALAHKVLDVNHRKAVRVLAEIVDRIAARENHPATVDLELNQPRIGFPQQQVVADAGAALGDEFEVVIVIDVLKSGARGLLADAVGELGGALRLVKAHAALRHAGRRLRLGRQRAPRSTGGVLRAQRVLRCESRIQIAHVELKMRAGTCETRLVEQSTELPGRELTEARGLDFAKPDPSKLPERTGGIPPDLLLDAVELDSDGSAEWCRTDRSRQAVGDEHGGSVSTRL